MRGPFKPEDFTWAPEIPVDARTILSPTFAAYRANEIDAKRWTCPDGGEHELNTRVFFERGRGGDIPAGSILECAKCRKWLRARWEAYP